MASNKLRVLWRQHSTQIKKCEGMCSVSSSDNEIHLSISLWVTWHFWVKHRSQTLANLPAMWHRFHTCAPIQSHDSFNYITRSSIARWLWLSRRDWNATDDRRRTKKERLPWKHGMVSAKEFREVICFTHYCLKHVFFHSQRKHDAYYSKLITCLSRRSLLSVF